MFKFVDNFAEQSHRQKRVISILGNQIRRAWYHHGRKLFKFVPPILDNRSAKMKNCSSINIQHCDRLKINWLYLGTMTSRVTKYSESRTKCSFFTKSPRFLVSKLPLRNVRNMRLAAGRHIARITNTYTCFFSKLCKLPFRLLYAADLDLRSVSI